MRFQLRTRPEAERDLLEARSWYERRSPQAAEHFREAIEATFASIAEKKDSRVPSSAFGTFSPREKAIQSWPSPVATSETLSGVSLSC